MNDAKTLPHSLQAEQCVLGCLMLDYVGCGDGMDRLTKSDFYSPAHQTIFESMIKMLEKKGKTIDFVTVTEALTTAKKLEAIGGIAYLNAISDAVPSVASFRQYFDIVKKNSTLRKINSAAKQILESSYASDDEQETLAEAEKAIFDISKAEERKELTHVNQELPVVMDRLVTIKNDPTSIYGIKTGFYGIDSLTNGLHKSELVILAARPGVGKTALGLNMVLHAGIFGGKRCAVFSLEMSKTMLTQRAICSVGMVNSYKAGRGELDDGEWQRLWQANDVIANANIYIDDNSEITPMEIKRKCMRLKREHGLDFVMIDYLGLMNSGRSKYENRQVEVASNSRAMKILAKELDIPVLLLAQLNRNTETRTAKGTDSKPALHDLRESGAIEQDADVVMFIHMNKPSEVNPDDQDGSPETASDHEVASVIIAKNRKGPCGTVELLWRKEYTAFANMPASQAAQDARDAASKKGKR